MMRSAPSASSLAERAAAPRLNVAAAFALASALAAGFAHAAVAQDLKVESRGTGEGASGPAEQVKPSVDFQKAAGTPAEAPTAFEFDSRGFSYHVAANGNGRRTKGDKTRRYNLQLGGGGESIRRLYFSDYEGDLLLLCEVEGGEGRPSVFVTRLEQPSMRALWKQRAPADGLEVTRRGGSLYLAGAGFVARLELKGGAFAWLHRDRRAGGDEADEKPGEKADALIPPGLYALGEVAGDAVTFRAARGPADGGPKTVRVNRKTGKIVSVE